MKTQLLAVPLLVFLSQAGFADSMEDSRQAYEAGNYAKAQAILLKAAENGDPRAQHGVGVMFENGQGVKQDYAEALKWYRKSADQGNSMALNGLAHLYYEGLGVKRDYAAAFKCYKKAAEGKDFAEAQAMAWNNLANLYYWGKGVKKSEKKAAECYKKAAESGDVFAMNNLGYFYEHGIGVDADTAAAAQYYRRAAESGFVAAEENLAVLRGLQGRDIPPDTKAAFAHLSKMAAEGRPFAQYQLGKMYENGIGVARDIVEAYRWYMTAAEKKFRPAMDSAQKLKSSLNSSQIEEADKRRAAAPAPETAPVPPPGQSPPPMPSPEPAHE